MENANLSPVNAAEVPHAEEAPEDIGKVLGPGELDALLKAEAATPRQLESNGIRAMLDRAMMSYERLPMLEVVFDRFVRMLSTGMRNLTAENVDVEIRSIVSLRYGDYINTVQIPALLTIFKVVEWENFGLISVSGELVYSLVDIMFGGRKIYQPVRFEGRPFTTIEQGIIRQLTDVILGDLGSAFEPLSPSTFLYERTETNPRFATISRPGDAAILLELQIDMEQRGGKIEILFPYATLEPIRDLLVQVFMGEKFGKDPTWELHLESELYNTVLEIEAVLESKEATLSDIMKLKVGSTIMMEHSPKDDVILCCYDSPMLAGRLGRVGDHIAISVTRPLHKTLQEVMPMKGSES
jgi:flagellar motor switch protein FliM